MSSEWRQLFSISTKNPKLQERILEAHLGFILARALSWNLRLRQLDYVDFILRRQIEDIKESLRLIDDLSMRLPELERKLKAVKEGEE